jgi:hypothetical protein
MDDAVIAKVWLGDCARDVVTSRGGDLIYVMTADSVKYQQLPPHRRLDSDRSGAETRQSNLCHRLRRFTVDNRSNRNDGENLWCAAQ